MSDAVIRGAGLICRGLSKAYSGVEVVKSLDLDLTPGHVTGLIGENGAGKSTTSSMIAGIVQPSRGSMTIDGKPYQPRNPAEALDNGVAIIHQEIRMVPELSVAENIFLGRWPIRNGVVDRAAMDEQAAETLSRLGTAIDPRRPVRGLSIAAQQEIEIAKALTRKPRYIIFDEPSASLGEAQTERIFQQINALRDSGAGIVYISHRLEEITELSDSIVCLRDGARVASWDGGSVPREELVNAMVGREFVYGHETPPAATDRVVLDVRDLCRDGVFRGVNFSVRAGEIVGIAGLVGAGRTEMVRTLAGADIATSGEIILEGKAISIRSPRTAISVGIHLVPEDRKSQGLNLNRSGVENIALPWERRLSRRGVVRRRLLEKIASDQREYLDIRGRTDIPVRFLSGGNQQKVLLGKWLVEQPKVLILDEPTRGVDVGAKMTIYAAARRLAESGVAVIVVSSELEEVLGLAHRVLVMANGSQQGLLDRDEATPEAVMRLAFPPANGASAATHRDGANNITSSFAPVSPVSSSSSKTTREEAQ